MKTHLLTLHLLLAVVLLAQLSSGEAREEAHHKSCRSGSKEESCGTEQRKNRYEKESQKKYMDDDDDDEDDDELSDEKDDDNGEDDTEDDALSHVDGDGVDTGGSKKKREAQEKRTKDSTRSDGRSSEGKKNKEVKGKKLKAPKDATDAGHDKSASKENKDKNGKRKHVKGDKAKMTSDSVTKKGKRNEGIDKNSYDPKKPSMKSEETSRMKRDVGNKGKSSEEADLGKPKKKGGKSAGNDKDSPETVANDNPDSSDPGQAAKMKPGKQTSADETDIEEGKSVERTGKVHETTATEDVPEEIQDEVVNADESRNTIPDASDATETTDKRDQETENDIHGAVSDSDDYASSEISSSESTVTPRSYEPPPFPQVTLEFDSTTMLPEHLRTGNSDMPEEETDTENWESHLSGGRKVEIDITSEQDEEDEASHDSNIDNLEDYEKGNQIHSDTTDENSIPLKSVQDNYNSVEAGENLQEPNSLENEETEIESLVQENPDTVDTDDAFGTDSGKK